LEYRGLVSSVYRGLISVEGLLGVGGVVGGDALEARGLVGSMK
jgi:hypothetical protein